MTRCHVALGFVFVWAHLGGHRSGEEIAAARKQTHKRRITRDHDAEARTLACILNRGGGRARALSRVSLLGDAREDSVDLLLKVHVQQLVCLVEDLPRGAGPSGSDRCQQAEAPDAPSPGQIMVIGLYGARQEKAATLNAPPTEPCAE